MAFLIGSLKKGDGHDKRQKCNPKSDNNRGQVTWAKGFLSDGIFTESIVDSQTECKHNRDHVAHFSPK